MLPIPLATLLLVPAMTDPLVIGDTTLEVIATIAVPEAPHGICFSPDGRRAVVACAGAHTVLVLDTATHEILGELPAGRMPLDVAYLPGGEVIMTEFQGRTMRRVSTDELHLSLHQTLQPGPSLFSPPDRHGRRYLVCEDADVVYELDADGVATRSWPTAKRPYPADVTADGILVFVPARDAGAVTVIDTLNNRHVLDVAVGERPQGGALTADDTSYVVACSTANELRYINTASFEVVHTVREFVGPEPFAVAMSADGRFGFVNNAGGDTVSILDVASRRIVGALTVGKMPIVVRAHPDGELVYVSNEGDHTVSVIRMRHRPAPAPAAVKTQVVVLGMIHGGHRESERYGLDVVRDLVRAIKPNDVCTEIPPNRIEAALASFRETGQTTEPRVKVFPEYADVILPLSLEMDFEIIPCAGWTSEMNDYRRARLKALSEEPARATQWAAYKEALRQMGQAITDMDGDDNARIIHTDEYDWVINQGFGPYNTFFNDDLADGGWDNINAKHYALIAAHLDRIRGQGRRVLITFGAAHKGWFLRELKARDDVELLEVGVFLDKVESGG